jgi:hypothetical protein
MILGADHQLARNILIS